MLGVRETALRCLEDKGQNILHLHSAQSFVKNNGIKVCSVWLGWKNVSFPDFSYLEIGSCQSAIWNRLVSMLVSGKPALKCLEDKGQNISPLPLGQSLPPTQQNQSVVLHDPKYNWGWGFSCVACSWISKWSWKHLPFATFLIWHHFLYLHWILVQEGPRWFQQKEASSSLQWQNKTGFSGPFWPRPGTRSPF